MKRIYEPFVPLCSGETAPGRERVSQAAVRVEEEEDVGVDGGVRHDGHSYDGLHDPAPRLVAPRLVNPDELVHHVGQVGDHEYCNNGKS